MEEEKKNSNEIIEENNKNENQEEIHNSFNSLQNQNGLDNDNKLINENSNNIQTKLITEDKIKVDEKSKSSKNSSKFLYAHKERLKKERYLYKISAFFSLLVIIFFTSSVFCQIEIENHYKVNKIIKSIYNFEDNYFHYGNLNEFETIFEVVFNNAFKEDSNEDLWLFDHKYKIISPIRITQRRMNLKEKKLPLSPLINDDIYGPKWYKEKIDINEKTGKFENENLDGFPKIKDATYLNNGGISFILDINGSINHSQFEKHNKNFCDNFYNENTATIVYDFVLVNYELKYIISVVISSQILHTGITKNNLYLYINDRNIYKTDWNIFRLVMEILFLIFFIINIIFFYIYIKQRADIHYKIENKFNETDKIKLNFIIYQIFTDFFLFIQFVFYILMLVAIILWLVYVIKMNRLYETIDQFLSIDNINKKNGLNYDEMNKLISAGKVKDNYKSVVVIIFLLLFIRVIDILTQISGTAESFIITISEGIGDIIAFFIFFICILIGFSLFSWIYYGRYFNEFRTLNKSFHQNLSFSFGITNNDLFMRMWNKKKVMTVFYFFFILIIMRLIIIKIVLAIMLHYFKIAYQNYENTKLDINIQEKIKEEKKVEKGLNFLVKMYSIIFHKIFDCLCCVKKTKYNKLNEKKLSDENLKNDKKTYFKFSEEKQLEGLYIPEIFKHNNDLQNLDDKANIGNIKNEDEDKNEEEKKEQKISDIKNYKYFDQEYDEDYEFNLRNAYFDSEREKQKVKLYYENKYRNYFKQTIIYILFLIVFLIVFLFTILMPYRSKIFRDIGAIFNSTHTKTNELFDLSKSYFSLSNLKEIKNFAFNDLKTFFKNGDFLDNKKEKLLGNTIFYTFRKERLINNNSLDNISIREEEVLNENFLTNENKSYIEKNGNYFIWNRKLSYKEYGGYLYELDLTDYDNNEDIENIIVAEDNTYLIIEFLCKNEDFKSIIYYAFKIKFDYGAYYFLHYDVQIVPFVNFLKPIDIYKVVFLCFYIIFLIIIIFNFFKSIKIEIIKYNKWYKDVIKPLNHKLIQYRNRLEHEFIRKIKAIFGFSKLIDVFIFFLSIGSIETLLMLIQKQYDIGKFKKHGDFDNNDKEIIFRIKKLIYECMHLKSIFLILGIIIIFLTSLKLLIIINLGKFFSLLIRTFNDSKKNIFIFIILLFILNSGFLFYSHLIFGEKLEDFYKIEKSIISLIKMFFGYINYVPLFEVDSFFGSIFFILYFVIINLILLNLFVSIIYTSYVNIKIDIKKTNEIWDWKNIYIPFYNRNNEILDNTIKIDTEFEYEKQQLTFKTNTLIYKEKYSSDDFIKNERENIISLEDLITKIRKKKNDIRLAYDSENLDLNCVFEDNLYKDVTYKNVKSSKVHYYNYLLYVAELLDNDTNEINEAIEHLIKHKNYVNYDVVCKNLEENNRLTREKIAKLDKNFMNIYNDLKAINDNKMNKDENYFLINNDFNEKDNLIDNKKSNEDENDDENNSENIINTNVKKHEGDQSIKQEESEEEFIDNK